MQTIITHHIQKYILEVLTYQKYARFRDLRPPKVDTNLFSYHLKSLQKDGWVSKDSAGYTLSRNGLWYVDRVSSEKRAVRLQPKIITMLVIQNSNGDILLHYRDKQPYIDTWTLPYGKVHLDDISLTVGAKREWRDKIGGLPTRLTHAGDCYIRVLENDDIISSTIAHIFYGECDDIAPDKTLKWARPHKLADFELAPAVQEIMTRTFFKDPYFFEEYSVDWLS